MLYTISPAARLDLEEASDYGDAVFGTVETDRYFRELDRIFETIADFPELARERTEYVPPVRIHRHRLSRDVGAAWRGKKDDGIGDIVSDQPQHR